MSAEAKPWVRRACEWVLTFGKEKPISPEIRKLADRFDHELSHESRYLNFHLVSEPEFLNFLKKNPESVQFIPESFGSKEFAPTSKFISFLNPDFINLSWYDEQSAPDHIPALLTVFEDVEVTSDGKKMRLSEVMLEEADSIRNHLDKDMTLNFELRFESVQNFKALTFKPGMEKLTVMWVDGSGLTNFQLKRIQFLTTFVAFQDLVGL